MSYLRQLFELYSNQRPRASYSSLYDYNYYDGEDSATYSSIAPSIISRIPPSRVPPSLVPRVSRLAHLDVPPSVSPSVAPRVAPSVAPRVAPSVSPNVSPSVGSIMTQLIIQSLSNVMQNAVHDLSNEIERQVNQRGAGQAPQNPLTHTFQFVILPYKNMPNKSEHTCCPICFDDYTPESMVLSTECLHFFHEDCLKKWVMTDVNQSCPICRTRL